MFPSGGRISWQGHKRDIQSTSIWKGIKLASIVHILFTVIQKVINNLVDEADDFTLDAHARRYWSFS